jgi:hypothetical protein
MRTFDNKGGLMIKMSLDAALLIIKSLIDQMSAGSPNVGRYERVLDDNGRDLSIAVEKP